MTFDDIMRLLDVVPAWLRMVLLLTWGGWAALVALVGMIALLRTDDAKAFMRGTATLAKKMVTRIRELQTSPLRHPRLRRLHGSLWIVAAYYQAFELLALIAGLWAHSLSPASHRHLSLIQHAMVLALLVGLPNLAGILKAEADREWLYLRSL